MANDDGYQAPGLAALVRGLRPLGRVISVAPDRERSAASHALTLHRPLRVTEVGRDAYCLDGTPADCVTFAVRGFLKLRPALVVSGINQGANLGDDVIYSGTVSAAMEGALLGCPAFAISLVTRGNGLPAGRPHYAAAAAVAKTIAGRILRRKLPPDTIVNVNVPDLPRGRLRGIRTTRLGKRRYSDLIEEKIDPRGRKYYWIGGDLLDFELRPETDSHAVARRYVSVTPLRLDMTDPDLFRELARWTW